MTHYLAVKITLTNVRELIQHKAKETLIYTYDFINIHRERNFYKSCYLTSHEHKTNHKTRRSNQMNNIKGKTTNRKEEKKIK